ncbi:MAG: SufS family cysteine desulfurase [Epsilonproteobacteria bacterium]|nr:SufS family cysteine desulfurase [Campylobacterota bacterium]
MDFKKVKNDFPLLANNPALSYLDSGATSQKPEVVIDAISNYYKEANANVHRAIYPLGERATMLYEQTREKVAKFINAASSCEVVFTKGTTESINFVAHSWALDHLKAGDEIVLTKTEHHANLLPWQLVAKQTGAKLVFVPLNTQTFECDDAQSVITSKTRLITVTQSSNVIGDIWQDGQLEAVIKKAHAVGARVLVDAAQTPAHARLDVQKLGADFVVFSPHKMFGPTGVGVLYIKQALHDDVRPYQVGGSMIFSATFNDATWAQAPQKFEAGTPPIASVIGLGAAIDYIEKNIDFDELKKHEAGLCAQLIDGLEKLDGVHIAGNKNKLRSSGHLVSFWVEDAHAHDVATFLGMHGVALRAGHHCAQPLANLLGVQSLLRASLCAYNNSEDIKKLLIGLEQTLTSIRSLSNKKSHEQSVSRRTDRTFQVSQQQ